MSHYGHLHVPIASVDAFTRIPKDSCYKSKTNSIDEKKKYAKFSFLINISTF